MTAGFAFWRNLRAKANKRAPPPSDPPERRPLTPIVFVFACAAAAAGLLWAERVDSVRLRWIFKPAASLAFVLAAVSSGAMDSPMGMALLAGLALSALGDGLLISRTDRLFLAGMAAFGLGQIAYGAAIAIGGIRIGYEAAIAGGLTLAAGLFFLRPMRAGIGAMSGPVGLYVIVISSMVCLAVAHFIAAGSHESLRLAVGAIAFAASDLAVARDQFGARAFINKAWGLPLYYSAQCLIATAV